MASDRNAFQPTSPNSLRVVFPGPTPAIDLHARTRTPRQPDPARPRSGRSDAARRAALRADAPRLADHRPGGRRQGDARFPLRPPAAGRAADGADRWRSTTHPVFRRVAAGAHADLLHLERASIRRASGCATRSSSTTYARLSDFLRLTPAEGGWRVVVVDRRRGNEPQRRQRAAESAGGAADPRDAAAGLRGAGPAAGDHPQPLPPAAAGAAAGRRE